MKNNSYSRQECYEIIMSDSPEQFFDSLQDMSLGQLRESVRAIEDKLRRQEQADDEAADEKRYSE